MITEDYCSFELSKLLKEKGFDEPCYGIWHVDNKLFDVNYEPLDYSELREERLLAPTHQMAMKWLREEHKIFVEVSVCIDTNGDYHYHSMALDKICEYILPSIGTYDTYEEAVEAAIKYVLEKFELSTEEYNSYKN